MTSKALPPTSRKWWKDGPAGDTGPPESPSKRRTLLRTASADRQRQYATGQQPLAVVDELVACLRQTTATVRVPRWAIDAAISEMFLRVSLDRRRGQNASLGAKAAMEATHRIRYEMVRKAEQLGFSGRFRFEAAVLLCGRERAGSVLRVRAVQQSYARIKQNPSFGSLSAQYVTAPSRSATDIKKEQRELLKQLNAIARKQQS